MYRPIEQNPQSEYSRRKIDTSNKDKGLNKIAKWKKLIFICFVVYLLFIGKGIYNQEKSISEKKLEVETLEQEYRSVTVENEKLQGKYERLHDEEYIAELARQNYYLSKPGEVLFIVPQQR